MLINIRRPSVTLNAKRVTTAHVLTVSDASMSSVIITVHLLLDADLEIS